MCDVPDKPIPHLLSLSLSLSIFLSLNVQNATDLSCKTRNATKSNLGCCCSLAQAGQIGHGLCRINAVLLTRAVLHEADQVSQKHDDRDFADGRDVDGSALLDVGVEVL
jgi:hypothetical protein